MHSPFPHKILNQQFWLTADRTLFWEQEKALVVSDLHFGKTGHFRKSGIAVPQSVYKEDLQRLVAQIQHFQPEQLIIVGDMFHSDANKELELFLKWRSDFPNLQIQLIRGNHDILNEEWYEKAGIYLSLPTFTMNRFHFVHDITDLPGAGLSPAASTKTGVSYFFSGHIHPGIRIQGAGRQSLCFPCFYFGKQYAVLPAFSRFTGVALIDPDDEDQVFAIVKNAVMRLQ
ncbi:MAG: ligase-associated DNA damage response endonuclease PdeM [Bacteroidota bacterium]|nr:ligase-associated DNA damage response endonuclease PdeM [Bacteroidota bacterium]MDP4212464.1 ligase-associated DNA damage response endonuclease PdeM [Bacteroidota bacterium]MDP4248808.1 ligase-associated DNA damage response endonuclease PdeM [Bacteroidota bacterium]